MILMTRIVGDNNHVEADEEEEEPLVRINETFSHGYKFHCSPTHLQSHPLYRQQKRHVIPFCSFCCVPITIQILRLLPFVSQFVTVSNHMTMICSTRNRYATDDALVDSLLSTSRYLTYHSLSQSMPCQHLLCERREMVRM